jgi:hypothetical protein
MVSLVPLWPHNLPKNPKPKQKVKAEGILLGVAVFGTYEYVLHQFQQSSSSSPPPLPPLNENSTTSSSNKLHSVLVHMTAGAAAGVAQSACWMLWESLVHGNWQLLAHRPHFCLRTTVHHAGGYMALFGSYQFIRQCLLTPVLLEAATTTTTPRENETIQTSLWEPAATFMAGGVSGQIHHVVNHYTSHWKLTHTTWPRPPRLGPTTATFIPIALSFTAYEYGEEVFESAMRHAEHAGSMFARFLQINQ